VVAVASEVIIVLTSIAISDAIWIAKRVTLGWIQKIVTKIMYLGNDGTMNGNRRHSGSY